MVRILEYMISSIVSDYHIRVLKIILKGKLELSKEDALFGCKNITTGIDFEYNHFLEQEQYPLPEKLSN